MNSNRPSRGPWFWFAYVVAFACVVLLVTEAGVRLLRLAPMPQSLDAMFTTDPYLPYRLRPATTITGQSPSAEFDFRYVHNRLGFRDLERSLDKPPGVYRIVAVGDSFTYGIGVPFEDTFVHRLESLLNQRPGDHPQVEVINAGIPRYYPEAERLLIEHYMFRFSPDLILVTFLPNDVIDTYYGTGSISVAKGGYLITSDAARALEALPAPLRALDSRSHLARWLIWRVVTARRAQRLPVVWSDIYVENGFHEEAWREVERQYAAMVELARSHGVQIVFANHPDRTPRDASAAYPGQRLARFCAARHVPFIDLLGPMRAAQLKGEMYWPIDGHTNSEGARVVALGLFTGLRDLVP